jgi:hypothetical protein
MPNFCSDDATSQLVGNTQLLINNKHRILRGTQSRQLNGEPRNCFLRRGPKTDKAGHQLPVISVPPTFTSTCCYTRHVHSQKSAPRLLIAPLLVLCCIRLILNDFPTSPWSRRSGVAFLLTPRSLRSLVLNEAVQPRRAAPPLWTTAVEPQLQHPAPCLQALGGRD